MKKTVLIVLSLLLMAALVSGVYVFQQSTVETVENAGMSDHAPDTTRQISYRGENIKMRRQLRTILLIGVDSDEKLPVYKQGELRPFVNYQQADFLLLMVVDDINRTIKMIHINRDSMSDVPWLDVTGKYGGKVYKQITLAHNSGCGLEDSCENTRDAVSILLFDMPIDHYMKICMGAVPVLNDSVGGVTVDIEDDLSSIDPEYVPGKTVTLTGDKALSYVRARKSVGDGSNLSRMRRQKTYMSSFMQKAKEAYGEDTEILIDTLNLLNSYMLTDMSPEYLVSLADCIETYEIQGIYSPEGTVENGEKFVEFYPDYRLMWKNMKEIVC